MVKASNPIGQQPKTPMRVYVRMEEFAEGKTVKAKASARTHIVVYGHSLSEVEDVVRASLENAFETP
jgi:hypothetical protein